MIRYNANAPEIKEHKQYNVMKGFGIWNIVCGSFTLLWFLLFSLSLAFSPPAQLRVGQVISLLIFMFVFLYVIIFTFGTGLGVLRRKIYTSKFVSVMCGISIGIFCLCFFIVMLLIAYAALTAKKSIGMDSLLLTAFMIFMLAVQTWVASYIFWSLRKTFDQPCVLTYLSRKSVLSDSVLPVESSEPQLVTLFEKWNPMYAYGRFMFYYGLITAFFVVMIMVGLEGQRMMGDLPWTSATTTFYMLIVTAFGLTITFSGYGLAKLKEWGRMMTVILHAILMVMPVFGILAILTSTLIVEIKFIAVFVAIIYSALLFPIFHWCYFVIRTLTSPVVKYVCLRGGYDIE